MTLGQSILMGVVQGLGEFLPISSSAHLVITPWLFRFDDPGLTFDVALHFGTLLALLAYFYRDWVNLIRGAYRYIFVKDLSQVGAYRLLFLLAFASVPGAIAGLLLEKMAEETFRSPVLIALNMFFMGIVLWWADRRATQTKALADIQPSLAITIGFWQMLALLPGVSRSGVTMTAGLMGGCDKKTAARFSFLLAFPITLGASLVKLPVFLKSSPGINDWTAIAVSAFVGFLSIRWMLQFVQKTGFKIFVVYRIVFAIAVLAVWLDRG